MDDLGSTADAFVAMAHRIVWCSVATVDSRGRPRSRMLHPIWEWDGQELVGWVGTTPSPKLAHLARTPYLSCTYWDPAQDTCTAECRAEVLTDDVTCTRIWNLFVSTPEPLGYHPAAIGVPGWDAPDAPGFVVLRLRPWRLRVHPLSILLAGRPADMRTLTWQE